MAGALVPVGASTDFVFRKRRKWEMPDQAKHNDQVTFGAQAPRGCKGNAKVWRMRARSV